MDMNKIKNDLRELREELFYMTTATTIDDINIAEKLGGLKNLEDELYEVLVLITAASKTEQTTAKRSDMLHKNRIIDIVTALADEIDKNVAEKKSEKSSIETTMDYVITHGWKIAGLALAGFALTAGIYKYMPNAVDRLMDDVVKVTKEVGK